jgi:hypothetical protein
LRRLQEGDGTRADPGRHRLKSRDQVVPEGPGLVVGLVEG